ncbi:MAG: phosphotransferase [Microthrixaceae bacterium]
MSQSPAAQQQFEALVTSTGLVAMSGAGVAATEPEYRFDAERTIASLASSLAVIHSAVDAAEYEQLPTLQSQCLTPQKLVERARLVATDNSVAPAELSAAYRHVTRERLIEILAEGADRMALPVEEIVLIQGNPCLSNLRFAGQELLGFDDWSHSALGDSYFDLALAASDLLSIFGPQPIQSFFGIYGLNSPDPLRLDWYLLAVELCTQR